MDAADRVGVLVGGNIFRERELKHSRVRTRSLSPKFGRRIPPTHTFCRRGGVGIPLHPISEFLAKLQRNFRIFGKVASESIFVVES